jgi:hypothetical protein
MKLGVIITMYDEHDLVLSSINNIRSIYPDSYIAVVQSDDKKGETPPLGGIKAAANHFEVLSDLSEKYTQHEYPARAVCRNFSVGFSAMYESCSELDMVIALTGDTLITDATFVERCREKMEPHKLVAMVSQAIGHSMHEEGPNGEPLLWKRCMAPDATDVTCSLIVLDGGFALQHRPFADIKLTNRYCSEQSLGDELRQYVDSFHHRVGRLNEADPSGPYSFNDGVVYHAMHGGPAARNN